MRLTRAHSYTSLAIALLAGLGACSPKPGEHEAAAAPGPVITKWTYAGDTGPDHWAQLGGKAVVCGTGTRQSPVDISGMTPQKTSAVQLNYNSVMATIQNTGKTVRVTPQDGGALVLDGVSYALKYIEFHSPSEHAINGHRATLESQFVHEDAKGDTVVVAVLYDVGVADPMLGSLWTYLPTDPGKPIPLNDLLINAQDLLPPTEDFYAYSGSLTTPPCTEGVTWLVYSSPLSVSAEQADAFERLVGPNARPMQKRNDRDYLHIAGS